MLEGPEDRLINNVLVHRDVWAYKHTFRYRGTNRFAYEKKYKLSVEVIPAHDGTSMDTQVSMKVFKEVGYSASARYQSLRITSYVPKDGVEPDIKIRFGSRSMGYFTEVPQTVKLSYIIDFIASIEPVNEFKNLVTLTNVDTGLGTRQVQVVSHILSSEIRYSDNWYYTDL